MNTTLRNWPHSSIMIVQNDATSKYLQRTQQRRRRRKMRLRHTSHASSNHCCYVPCHLLRWVWIAGLFQIQVNGSFLQLPRQPWQMPFRHRNIIWEMNIPNYENSPGDSSQINMDILRQRMDRQESQYAKLLLEQSKYYLPTESKRLDRDRYGPDGQKRSLPESVHIILFHPDTPKQHVHTLEFPKESGNNIILAFEDEHDCGRFARMLRDLQFVDPCVSTQTFAIIVFVLLL